MDRYDYYECDDGIYWIESFYRVDKDTGEIEFAAFLEECDCTEVCGVWQLSAYDSHREEFHSDPRMVRLNDDPVYLRKATA